MKPILGVLSDGEIATVHHAALRILGEIGMKFPLGEAVSLLVEAGATDAGHGVVRIPARIVERALECVPKRAEVTLHGRIPAHDVTFDGHDPSLACMTMALSVIDPDSGQKRPATNRDLARLTRIADALPNIGINGGLVTPQDVPGAVNDWFTWATCIKNTDKHITGGMHGARCVRDAARMACAAVGEETFRARPFISGWVLTTPPLGMDEVTLEALIEMGRWNIPAMISSGPMVGATSPVTLAGTVAQAHAEILACIAVAQLASPGAPVVYTSFARIMDMKTAGISMASPEFAVLKVAMAQMGRSLDLPVRMPSMLRDAKTLDAQAGFETGMVGAMATMVADVMDSMQLDMDLVVDYADLAFCDECMAALRRLVRPLVVDEEGLALDVIRAVGPGGHFLGEPQTYERFRTELWHPKLMERRSWELWEEAGAPDIRAVALDRVRRIIEAAGGPLLAAAVEAEIDSIVMQAVADFAPGWRPPAEPVHLEPAAGATVSRKSVPAIAPVSNRRASRRRRSAK